MRTKKKRSFTLIELLVVVAIIALLISILLPSLARARELSKRAVCLSNLRQLLVGNTLYADQHNPSVFPAYCMQGPGTAQLRVFDLNMRNYILQTPPTTNANNASPSLDLWLLNRIGATTPKLFVCPSTTDAPDPAQDFNQHWDFGGPLNLSYGYQNQHDTDCKVLKPDSGALYPVIGDANPYLKGGVTSQLLADRVSAWNGNSANHTSREVSQIAYADGHAEAGRDPAVGLAGVQPTGNPKLKPYDNVYSTHPSSAGAAVDPGNAQPTPPITGTAAVANGFNFLCNLGSRSDTCLLP